MKWHNCKTDPPKKGGHYIIKTTNPYENNWVGVVYYVNDSDRIGHWFDDYEEYICYDDCAYKWAEVNLEEDE